MEEEDQSLLRFGKMYETLDSDGNGVFDVEEFQEAVPICMEVYRATEGCRRLKFGSLHYVDRFKVPL